MAHPLDGYLRELKELHDSRLAQDEPPYYRHLAALLDAVGRSLQPAVRCVIHPRSIGAGLPDGGLFTRDQLDKTPGGRWRAAIPAGGRWRSRVPVSPSARS